MKDPYYDRSEVSNSDLSWLKEQLYPIEKYDPTEAYKFGTLIDCMLTEPEKVNYSLLTCAGEQYKKEDFERADAMRRAFMKDETSRKLLEVSTPQKVMVKHNQQFTTDGFNYSLSVRCKWDLWLNQFNWGGDIKSTTAETQKQFEAAVRHFDYDRQRVWYMTIAGSSQDMLIGISKKNFKVFKVPIKRGDDLWKSGESKMLDLSFKWWMMFEQ